ncbi:hypothetical protein C2G38_941916 [Gigaspora rosea]|uniref:Uncharacterized protein n=1 Tax=Gigaspora rosea TaxID=44941 RepID=A0A397TZG6_9GLOM|nr:hypothetical protein C2G38_941916 [Gigaspora rosea]
MCYRNQSSSYSCSFLFRCINSCVFVFYHKVQCKKIRVKLLISLSNQFINQFISQFYF